MPANVYSRTLGSRSFWSHFYVWSRTYSDLDSPIESSEMSTSSLGSTLLDQFCYNVKGPKGLFEEQRNHSFAEQHFSDMMQQWGICWQSMNCIIYIEKEDGKCINLTQFLSTWSRIGVPFFWSGISASPCFSNSLVVFLTKLLLTLHYCNTEVIFGHSDAHSACDGCMATNASMSWYGCMMHHACKPHCPVDIRAIFASNLI